MYYRPTGRFGHYIFRTRAEDIVAMSYEMSLCFGSTPPEPATSVNP